MRLSFSDALAVFHSTPCIKDSSSLSILLQPFCSLRSIQSGSAVGRLVVSERSFLFWQKIRSVKLIRLNSKYAISQLSFPCLCCILQFSQSVGEVESYVSVLSVMKSKENVRERPNMNILGFPSLTTEVEDIWVLIAQSKNFGPLRLESTQLSLPARYITLPVSK